MSSLSEEEFQSWTGMTLSQCFSHPTKVSSACPLFTSFIHYEVFCRPAWCCKFTVEAAAKKKKGGGGGDTT